MCSSFVWKHCDLILFFFSFFLYLILWCLGDGALISCPVGSVFERFLTMYVFRKLGIWKGSFCTFNLQQYSCTSKMRRAELTNQIKPILYNVVIIDWLHLTELAEDNAVHEVTFGFCSKKIQWTKDAAQRLRKGSKSEGQMFCSVIAELNFPCYFSAGIICSWFLAEHQQVQFCLSGKSVTGLKFQVITALSDWGLP